MGFVRSAANLKCRTRLGDRVASALTTIMKPARFAACCAVAVTGSSDSQMMILRFSLRRLLTGRSILHSFRDGVRQGSLAGRHGRHVLAAGQPGSVLTQGRVLPAKVGDH